MDQGAKLPWWLFALSPAQPAGTLPPMAPVLTIASLKGGVGKTSSATALACHWSASRRVLWLMRTRTAALSAGMAAAMGGRGSICVPLARAPQAMARPWDLVLMDTAGGSRGEQRTYAEGSDFVLAPCQVAAGAIEQVAELGGLLLQAGPASRCCWRWWMNGGARTQRRRGRCCKGSVCRCCALRSALSAVGPKRKWRGWRCGIPGPIQAGLIRGRRGPGSKSQIWSQRSRWRWADGLLQAGGTTGSAGAGRHRTIGSGGGSCQGAKSSPPAKRQGWKAATFYLRPETLQQLRRIVGLRKLEGGMGDLSDALEESLQAWISKQGEQPTSRLNRLKEFVNVNTKNYARWFIILTTRFGCFSFR
jgi:hypothetical protein